MRIYRILNGSEYRCFLNHQSLFNPRQESYRPQGMLFPENADRFGKFFFFELEDLYNFVYYYSNAKPSDPILEIDIDRETALKYLSNADYVYFDPSKSGKTFTKHELEHMGRLRENLYTCSHAVPELYIDHNLINQKILDGEFRILSPESILKYKDRPVAYFESDRNPKLVELSKRLKRVKRLRQKRRELEASLEFSSPHYAKVKSGEEQPNNAEQLALEKLNALDNEIQTAVDSAVSYFSEFSREHEKYMALVPIAESQPE